VQSDQQHMGDCKKKPLPRWGDSGRGFLSNAGNTTIHCGLAYNGRRPVAVPQKGSREQAAIGIPTMIPSFSYKIPQLGFGRLTFSLRLPNDPFPAWATNHAAWRQS